jgi:YebC/PmpR family DNA-binding regulatory protein
MSGHSKWSTIKRKKAKTDAARGKVFTRVIKDITIAAREGGGDEASNTRLRSAIAAAKAVNMPQTNIERAIKKGTGELEGVSYEHGVLEGYGPGGAALYIDFVTDNRNRTVAEIRHIISKHGGNLAESGAVAWIFEKKGLVVLDKQGVDEDTLLELTMEAGAEDLKNEDDVFEIVTSVDDLEKVKKALEQNDVVYESAGLTMYPKNTVDIDGKQTGQMLRMMDLLEEHDDVENVYANFDFDAGVIEELDS